MESWTYFSGYQATGPRLMQRAGHDILIVQNKTYRAWLPKRVYGQNLMSDRPRVNENLLYMMRQ